MLKKALRILYMMVSNVFSGCILIPLSLVYVIVRSIYNKITIGMTMKEQFESFIKGMKIGYDSNAYWVRTGDLEGALRIYEEGSL